MTDVGRSEVVRGHFPALATAASQMGCWQVRNRATLGGNLCNAAPSADTAPPLLVYQAVALMDGASGATRDTRRRTSSPVPAAPCWSAATCSPAYASPTARGLRLRLSPARSPPLHGHPRGQRGGRPEHGRRPGRERADSPRRRGAHPHPGGGGRSRSRGQGAGRGRAGRGGRRGGAGRPPDHRRAGHQGVPIGHGGSVRAAPAWSR